LGRGFRASIKSKNHHNLSYGETNGLKHNAFRWLRDSGFNSTAYAISNRTFSTEVEAGLLAYARLYSASAAPAGILPLIVKQDDMADRPLPQFSMPEFRAKVYAAITLLVVVGTVLLFWPCRKNGA